MLFRPMGAMALGTLASVVCFFGLMLKEKLGYDDSLDAFGVHGVGGIIGAIFLVFFIRNSWMENAAAAIGGEWTVWDQLGVQVLAVLIAMGLCWRNDLVDFGYLK